VIEWRDAPGYASHKEAFGELTVTIEREQIREACTFAKDELGFTLLSDIVATDYLGWGSRGVSGYIATASGRDINFPSTQGLQNLPEVKTQRFSVSYHLLAMRRPPARVRLQVWADDGDSVPSVVPVWPGADFYEREQFDMFGIPFDGHPNLARLLMPDDWEGHPLRKDYPIGGEPVRFSEAE
jgi:NADH:ubiquinone oxidoreductase subunit C